MKRKSQYTVLHAKMRNKCKISGYTYLPNPLLFDNFSDVEYCLIGMEPSSKGKDISQSERDKSVNFYSSVEDIILHYCAWKFLGSSGKVVG